MQTMTTKADFIDYIVRHGGHKPRAKATLAEIRDMVRAIEKANRAHRYALRHARGAYSSPFPYSPSLCQGAPMHRYDVIVLPTVSMLYDIAAIHASRISHES
jgi:hypothetical protein